VHFRKTAILMVMLAAAMTAAHAQEATPEVPARVPYLVPVVSAVFPRSPADFTQGLVWDEGRLFQSTGLYGESRLLELDPESGEVIQDVELDDTYFGEGLALVDDSLIQITWREETAFVYDAETFEPTGTYTYEGEGWGLCYDGSDLWMSDGSDQLFRRDAVTFAMLETVPVTLFNSPVPMLNELECVDGTVYANVWQTDYIVQIDPTTGEVIAVIDGSQLIAPEVRATFENGAVLNGIAYDPEREVFLLTGKLWPSIFEVTFERTGDLVERSSN